ncbi:MAG TPA: ABC transporter ATP-binding protein [Vicinamibacterales bacterium]|nr:ABC transporter ATP-binding protein [Vicinamibacterales bacterium]
MSDALAIETIDLRKRYDGTDALCGLDLRVPQGSIAGFLGRNGAGKTTTMKILLGMAKPTSGVARVLGLDATRGDASVEIRRRAGFVSEEKDLYDYMTVDEIVRFTAAFFPTWRRDLEARYRRAFALTSDARVKTLSRGARSKLALLLALCRGAELLLLDEPTAGLDPAAAHDVLQRLVSHAAADGVTIFFSSHQLAEVDQIADHVAIVDRGRIAVAGALDELREQHRRVQFVFDGAAPAASFRSTGVTRVDREGRVMTVLCRDGAESIVAEARALGPVSVDVMPVTLQDIFLDTVTAEEE